MESFTFPKEFLWGTATSGHQIEGFNKKSDWWAWENRKRKKDPWLVKKLNKSRWPLEPSQEACDSYNRYEEDFSLAAQLNNNAVRFGLEWSRLEPEEGSFDYREFKHYKQVLYAARREGLRSFVTLHHFASPLWFIKDKGWTGPESAKYFARYAKKCAEEFGDLIDVYLTINEPQVYAMMSYLTGNWPPQSINPLKTNAVMINMIHAHNKAYQAIKEVGDYPVGLVKNIAWYERSPSSKNPLDTTFAAILRYLNSDYFLRPISKNLDLLGLNYYFTNYVKYFNPRANPNDRVSDMGWWLETSGLGKILSNLKQYNLPIYITENGLADAEDSQRASYLNEILWQCADALNNGVNLQGYFHWSLLDNYEWAQGFWPRFGLVEVDRTNNLQRKPRPSFDEYAKICKSGTISR
jgi:beta-glucosidase